MFTLTVYLKDHRRMPLHYGHPLPFRDPQADFPHGWCVCCGCEVFESGMDRCAHCHEAKGDKEDAA